MNLIQEGVMTRAKLPAENGNAKNFYDDFETLFGKPPVLTGEDAEAFTALKQRLFEGVKPADFIEAMAINDLLNLVWETTRLRRLRARLLETSDHEGLQHIVGSLIDSHYSAGKLTRVWALSGREASGDLAEIMEAANIDREAIQAQTLAVKLNAYEAIDRMIERADARRIVVMRELDRHREALARRIKDAVAEIEDATFEVVDPDVSEAAE